MAIVAVLAGLIVLVWSADRFVDGASATSVHLGLSPLLVGMLVIGFGTSAPELVVSALAAMQGNPGLALGNAYGSNIANVALIVGTVAVLSPLWVPQAVIRRELPLLGIATLLSGWWLLGGEVTRGEGVSMLMVLVAMLVFSVLCANREAKRSLEQVDASVEASTQEASMSLNRGVLWTLFGLVLLVVSSRLLVWGATHIAEGLGVSDLVIGLTVVAIGTSLPELASSLSAARKGQHEMVLGNVVGSNLFNTLGVVGLAGLIHPIAVDPAALVRDWPVMAVLTLALAICCFGFRGRGRITRWEGVLLLVSFVVYTGWLVLGVILG